MGNILKLAFCVVPFVALYSCSEDSVEPSDKNNGGSDGNGSVEVEDTVATKAASISRVYENATDYAVTGTAYNVQVTTASVPLRFNASEKYLGSSAIALLYSDNPTMELKYENGCRTAYITGDQIEKGGLVMMYLKNLVPGATYRYRAYFYYNDAVSGYGEELTFTTKSPEVYSCQAIDLGLSVKWGDVNLGASRAYQAGNYYYYGVTSRNADESSSSSVAKVDISATDKDPVFAELGEGWASPTYDQLYELASKGSWVASNLNGYAGYRVYGIGEHSGNYIFIPCAGYYNTNGSLVANTTGVRLWSGEIYSTSSTAWCAMVNADGSPNVTKTDVLQRLPIRPVFTN